VDALTKRLSTRFLVVTVMPNVLFIVYVGFLLAAGAPTRSPSLARAAKVLDALTIRQAIVVLVAVLIISVAIHPLQTPLIQFVEGYWQALPFGQAFQNRCTNRFRSELRWAEREIKLAGQSYQEALYRRDWLPPTEDDLRPTALGNTLSTGEIRAGERYLLDIRIAMPRLAPLLSARSLAELRDRRNQLDAAVRLCVGAGLSTVVGLGLLLWHEHWLFLPLGTYLVSWLCYRSAVAAARGFSDSLAAAVDLHHLKLFDALQLERPASLAEEWDLNTKLDMLFKNEIDRDVADELRYVAPQDH
jgi:hypothetical protein